MSVEAIEIELLLDGVYRHYGFDFREYAAASIRRRILGQVAAEGAATVSELQGRVLHDPECMERLLKAFSINATAMFRDPTFYAAFRQKVVPLLRTWPFVRIWHAGCSTGAEIYSLAILLQEEGLYPRCRIYATDMNEAVVNQAREGIVPLARMQEYTENYLAAGGTRAFSEYYTARYEGAVMRPDLRDNVVFSHHNLATDGAFNEFNLIICRNVMIYFGGPLRERVHQLFLDSLSSDGVLALGRQESMRFSAFEEHYKELDGVERLYRRAA
jgi:chemotaxis protein methyltransferase CheR